MTVAELLARVSSRELSEWMAYSQVEPWGEERADLRAGIVASTVANTARNAKKRHKPFKPEEFMPTFERKTQTMEQQQEIARMFARAGLGKIKRGAG